MWLFQWVESLWLADGTEVVGCISSGSRVDTCALAWTKNPKLGVDGSLMVANDVSIPKECFDKISEFLKRNWPRAARF